MAKKFKIIVKRDDIKTRIPLGKRPPKIEDSPKVYRRKKKHPGNDSDTMPG